MADSINRLYEFLLADPEKDPDYTEGNEVGGYLVYGSALEMKARFSQAFGKQPIPPASSLFGIPLTWHIEDCTIRYESKKDTEIPNNPHCFGFLTVVGSEANVDRVNDLLTRSFPRIDELFHESRY